MAEAGSPTPFLIFATQRTGSSWVSTMLGSHPAVETFGELFQRGAKRENAFGAYVERHGGRRNRFARPGLTFAFLDDLYAPRRGVEATGFKLMYQDVKEHPYVLAYIARRRVRVVHLVRANLLDIVVSNDTARARGRFHASEGDVPEQVSVAIDPTTVVSRLEALDRKVRVARALLAAVRAPRFEVSYEELVAAPHRYTDVLRFLGVREPDAELTTQLKKLNTLRKDATISNYDAIESVLRPTRFAVFLES